MPLHGCASERQGRPRGERCAAGRRPGGDSRLRLATRGRSGVKRRRNGSGTGRGLPLPLHCNHFPSLEVLISTPVLGNGIFSGRRREPECVHKYFSQVTSGAERSGGRNPETESRLFVLPGPTRDAGTRKKGLAGHPQPAGRGKPDGRGGCRCSRTYKYCERAVEEERNMTVAWARALALAYLVPDACRDARGHCTLSEGLAESRPGLTGLAARAGTGRAGSGLVAVLVGRDRACVTPRLVF